MKCHFGRPTLLPGLLILFPEAVPTWGVCLIMDDRSAGR